MSNHIHSGGQLRRRGQRALLLSLASFIIAWSGLLGSDMGGRLLMFGILGFITVPAAVLGFICLLAGKSHNTTPTSQS